MLIELFTAQQEDLLGNAIGREHSRLETELMKWREGSAEYWEIKGAMDALSGVYSQLHGQTPAHFVVVGEAGSMPGTGGGFTQTVFNGKLVPDGTKVYAKVPR